MYVPASQEEAFQASKMLRKQTPQEVWNKTGVAKYGNDFVKEISDKNAVAGFTHLEGVNNGERLRELAFDNPQLYSLMPELKNFGQLGLRENKMSGSFQKVGDTGSLVGYAPNENDLKTVMAHEVQHGIQDLSGWERGGSTKDIALDIAENKLKAEEIASKLERMQNKASDEAKRATPDLIAQATQWANKTMPQFFANADKSKIVKDYLLQNDPIYASLYQNHADLAYNKPALLGAEETYKRLAGEVQARSTQNRVNLTDEQRKQFFPFELKSEANPYGLDVAPEDLVFRTQMGQNQLRKNPKAAMENQNELRKPVNTFQYPLAPAGTRYEEFGGKLTYMTPDEFLQRVRPLQLDPESLDNIAALKQHVQSGGKLDPLHIYETGKEDGRHRAYLAKELGIEKIPVALHGKQKDAYSQNEMRKFMRQGR